MVGLVYCLTNLLFFDIPLFYYYINLRSLILFCLYPGDIYLSLGISLSCSFVTVSEFFETHIILLAILLPIKSTVASALFSITLFEAVLIASVAVYLA